MDELVDSAREHDVAFGDEVAAMHDRKDFACIMVGDEDADIFIAQMRYHPFDLVDGDRIDVSKWLVKQQKGRIGDERTRDLQAAPLPSG